LKIIDRAPYGARFCFFGQVAADALVRLGSGKGEWVEVRVDRSPDEASGAPWFASGCVVWFG
jgi:hypothetical protein